MHWSRLWVDDAEANTLTYSEAFHNSVQAGLTAYAVPLLAISVESTFKNYQFQSSQW
jgi:ferredoxin-nitrate reductase